MGGTAANKRAMRLARRRVHVRSETPIIVIWWLWVVVAFLLLSVAVSFAVAAILGRIGAEVSQLIETEIWTKAPLGREALEVPDSDARSSRSEHAAAPRRR